VSGDLKHNQTKETKIQSNLTVIQAAKNSIVYSRKHTCLVYILALRDDFAF
jgi:hypothetical protein